ncbi:HD domain-containing protein [Ekhidna sp.]|uniref:HD domain-containing protein n=1 Tax=Ekhidna sp. TaxID=2608089 RepID=UPI003B513B94
MNDLEEKMLNSKVVSKVKDYVIKVLSKQLPDHMTYHSINHTIDVVDSAEEIAGTQNLKQEEIEIILIAAWFHDIGYAEGCENHEINSAKSAENFLQSLNYPTEKIELVVGCIMATQMPQNPSNIMEKVLCDADLMHLADENYFHKADLLHQEIQKTKLCEISENEWFQMNEEFLEKHCFFTEYARKNYELAVKENLKKVRDRLKSWQKAKK